MNYFCNVHLQSKRDEERRIFIVLDAEKIETDRPQLKKEILLANAQYHEFVQKYRPKLVLADYTVYATETEVYASSQDEVFLDLIENNKATLIGSSDLRIDCINDKFSGKRKKKSLSPVMLAVMCGGVLIVGFFFGFGICNIMGKSNARTADADSGTDSYVTDENGMIIPEQEEIAEDAEQITVTIDRSYFAVPTEDLQLKGEVTEGVAYITLPDFDKTDYFTHVSGYTWGFTSDPEGDVIEYYAGTTYAFSKDTKLYRVLVKYGGGSGTKDDPYLINYYDQLELMAQEKARGYFLQTADIVFPSYASHTSIDTVNELKNSPDAEYFEYDGGGYSISGLDHPLFGKISGALIQNVNIMDSAVVTTEYADCGLLVCEAYNYRYTANNGVTYETGETQVKNCTVSNSSISIVSDSEDEEEEVEIVEAETVIPPNLIEYDEDGSIIETEAETQTVIVPDTASGEYAVGMLTGLGGEIEGCYVSDGSVSVSASDYILYAGGISGKPANITNCAVVSFSAQGNIFYAGGIAGSAGGARMYDASGSELPEVYGGNIQGCLARSVSLSAERAVGGIAGEGGTDGSTALISNCYAFSLTLETGISEGDEDTLAISGFSGGIIGMDGNESSGHYIINTVSPSDFSVIGSRKRSIVDDTVRLAPDYAFYQENILTVLNRNTVNPDDPKEIFTGEFVFGSAFSDSTGSLAYPAAIEDLLGVTSENDEDSD